MTISSSADDYGLWVREQLQALGVPISAIAARDLPLCMDAEELVVAEVGNDGRVHQLTPDAALAWRDLRTAAANDDVTLWIVSAFRSFARQTEIIRRKLAQGLAMEEIIAVSAPPGYSEHHTGRAVDLGCPECSRLVLAFAETPAYRWLLANAHAYGFGLSYPADNRFGFAFEPWHWSYQQRTGT